MEIGAMNYRCYLEPSLFVFVFVAFYENAHELFGLRASGEPLTLMLYVYV